MEHITSRQNPLLQHVRKLQQSKAYRLQTRQFVADGTKLLQEAATWYRGLHTVILAQDVIPPQLPPNVRVVLITRPMMQWLSQMEAPQGALFLCDMPAPAPLQVQPGCLILDGIQDPGNLGTILRTADALQVPVVLSEGCADVYNEKTVRATMGAVFRTQPQWAQKQQIIRQCQIQKIPLAVTALTDTAQDIRHAPLSSCAVVIGSEGRGICQEYAQAAQMQLIIPMNANCESLNAAVAATIVMWQMKR